MKHEVHSPNVGTYTTLTDAFSKVRFMDQVDDLYNEMVQEGCILLMKPFLVTL